jgi:hypothetical protein
MSVEGIQRVCLCLSAASKALAVSKGLEIEGVPGVAECGRVRWRERNESYRQTKGQSKRGLSPSLWEYVANQAR